MEEMQVHDAGFESDEVTGQLTPLLTDARGEDRKR